MHVENTCQVVCREFTFEPESLQRRQCFPSIVNGEKQGETGGVIQEIREFRGENLVEVGQAWMTRDDGSWTRARISIAVVLLGTSTWCSPRSGGISSTLSSPRSSPFAVSTASLTTFTPPFPDASTPAHSASSRADNRNRCGSVPSVPFCTGIHGGYGGGSCVGGSKVSRG